MAPDKKSKSFWNIFTNYHCGCFRPLGSEQQTDQNDSTPVEAEEPQNMPQPAATTHDGTATDVEEPQNMPQPAATTHDRGAATDAQDSQSMPPQPAATTDGGTTTDAGEPQTVPQPAATATEDPQSVPPQPVATTHAMDAQDPENQITSEIIHSGST
ncbi:hypothetical protein Tsubulata_043515 [Turnera subulata]|uniref:Uncharacterized protein n=1 Tax=Turnera subulata TaxID=218843 RepID=A0A9Q0JLG0_9ROSI|nr:hypothetical protein Tsubulata_043515 [Turnera subulata]